MTIAAEFGPKGLKAVRQSFDDAKRCPSETYKRTRRIVRLFNSATAEVTSKRQWMAPTQLPQNHISSAVHPLENAEFLSAFAFASYDKVQTCRAKLVQEYARFLRIITSQIA